ncbi:MAG: AlkZ family DNA glycosylase [Bacteroidetes bacterium]|nr:AlkZ family DNA glycosylase [Bacteroidota bacterium]
MITSTNISHYRLRSQHLTARSFDTITDIVHWMGAIQAQDYHMAKWAIGSRLKNHTDTSIQEAINNGDIIRTHVLRPTWHLVASEDIYWMLELSAPQIKRIMQSRNKELQLSESVYLKSNAIIERVLADGGHLTREEIMLHLHKAGIKTDNNRASHLMMRAELDAIVGSGALKNKKQTYALLSTRVKKVKSYSKDEALAQLATIYFSSHGPATLQDFTWWSGLLVKDANHALEMIKNTLVSDTIDTKLYWFHSSLSSTKKSSSSVHLLPSFDEFLISYKDRSAAISSQHQARAFSNNGIFYPIIVMDGRVTGIWKRTHKKDKVIVELEFFEKNPLPDTSVITKAVKAFGEFLNTPAELIYKKA